MWPLKKYVIISNIKIEMVKLVFPSQECSQEKHESTFACLLFHLMISWQNISLLGEKRVWVRILVNHSLVAILMFKL